MTNNPDITHFRIVKKSNKKELKHAMKSIISGAASPTDFPMFADTHHIRTSGLEIEAKGGVTIVSDDITKESAIAVCGLKEHFCRRKGRDIAIGRLNKIKNISDPSKK